MIEVLGVSQMLEERRQDAAKNASAALNMMSYLPHSPYLRIELLDSVSL